MSWLPFYHDMGLIVGVFIAAHARLPRRADEPDGVPAEARPLDAAARDRSPRVLGGAELRLRAGRARRTTDADMEGKDLSGVHAIISGSERVHAATIRRFNERFAAFGLPDRAMRPSYGLAEATVYVVASAGGRPPTPVRFDYEKLAAGHAERCAVDEARQGQPRVARAIGPRRALDDGAHRRSRDLHRESGGQDRRDLAARGATSPMATGKNPALTASAPSAGSWSIRRRAPRRARGCAPATSA